MLWVDTHRPKSLAKMDYHTDLSDKLTRMVENGDFPHLMFYGPSGAGKKTRIMALLRQVYGPGVEKLRIENKEFKVGPSKRKTELTVLSSVYHIEITPADVGNLDTYIIQDMIKEVASSQQIDANSQRNFKVVILNEVDRLSRQAQNSLRRTMEKYTSACRLILCCNSTTKVIMPLRSRCLGIRIAAPTNEEICHILSGICRKEGLTLPAEFAMKVARKSRRNLRRAILMLEASRVNQYPFTEDQVVQVADWEMYIDSISTMIIEEQSPKRLLEVRGKFYELLTHCIPAEIILKRLVEGLLPKLDANLKFLVVYYACLYEHRMQQGSKAVFHLEAFVARFMSLYKNFLIENFGF